jgi:mannose-6-phosphate isomerase-like protein (cupin superfamily)
MAHAGQAIANVGTGEHMIFRATSADTGGERLEFELTLAPLGRVGGVPHKHAASERFTILAGRLTVWVGPARREVGPGDALEVPAGATHYICNDGDEDVRASVVVRPARDFESFFETVFAIAARRRFKAFRGLPSPLHGALLADTYGVYGPLLPIAVQRPLVRPTGRAGPAPGVSGRAARRGARCARRPSAVIAGPAPGVSASCARRRAPRARRDPPAAQETGPRLSLGPGSRRCASRPSGSRSWRGDGMPGALPTTSFTRAFPRRDG